MIAMAANEDPNKTSKVAEKDLVCEGCRTSIHTKHAVFDDYVKTCKECDQVACTHRIMMHMRYGRMCVDCWHSIQVPVPHFRECITCTTSFFRTDARTETCDVCWSREQESDRRAITPAVYSSNSLVFQYPCDCIIKLSDISSKSRERGFVIVDAPMMCPNPCGRQTFRGVPRLIYPQSCYAVEATQNRAFSTLLVYLKFGRSQK